MSNQSTLDFESQDSGPVECLGQTFPSDDARREHYLDLLAEKLKYPEFRKIDGFPIGEDEDILALSDPPYYTACPNPWIGEFVRCHGRDTEHSSEDQVEPYSGDLNAEARHPVYSFHPYHTKVPPDIIKTLIQHYTTPGDVVMDIFSGTGMTGVAARESGRFFVGNDLAPISGFISSVNNRSFDAERAIGYLEYLLAQVKEELGWLYQTEEEGVEMEVNYFVWCDVFTCPECACEFPFFPHGVIHHGTKVETRKSFPCPECSAELNVRRINRVIVYEGKKRHLAWCNAGTGRARINREPNGFDLKTSERVAALSGDSWVPDEPIDPDGYSAKLAQLGDKEITDISRFLSPRNRLIFSRMWELAKQSEPGIRNLVLSTLTSIFTVISERQGYFGGGGGMSGNLYMPIVRMEKNPFQCLKRKFSKIRASEAKKQGARTQSVISTQSSCDLTQLPDNSVDYIYTDPPFGANIIYNEMNLILDGWLRIKTSPENDAVIDETTEQDHTYYGRAMRSAFGEAFRALKPDHWITVEFHNTQASIWNLIQSSLAEVGFVIANVAKLDKGSTTILADIRPGAAVQDLLISAYKPVDSIRRDVENSPQTLSSLWAFIDSHLSNLPVAIPRGGQLEFVAERDPRILYDRMVAFYVGRNVPVPLSAAEFLHEIEDRYLEREGMVFLPRQVAEFDKQRVRMNCVGQMSIFVEDEKSAIDWLRGYLKARPSSYQDILPEFMKKLRASWKKFETRPELTLLLEQNFLQYHGEGDVPSQIHSYLSTQNKDLRNLPKDDARLNSRAKDRWYVPDPAKAVDVESLRNKRLLQEFWELCDEAGINRPTGDSNQPTLPNITPPKKKTGKKKLKEVRTEAIRLGFKECFAAKDYATILALAAPLPDNVIEEDENLQMIYDMAEMQSEG